jgi:hypothetical protein
MTRKRNHSPKRAKRKEVTERDLWAFVTGPKEFAEAKKIVRSIIDDDPIDLKRLQGSLRDILAAIRKVRSSAMCTKKLDRLLVSHEKHYASLLGLIVGKPH